MLRLINFIKVIRVAKVIESTKKVRSNIRLLSKSNRNYRTLRTRREAHIIDEKEKVDKILGMTINYRGGKKLSIFNRTTSNEPSPKINLIQEAKQNQNLPPILLEEYQLNQNAIESKVAQFKLNLISEESEFPEENLNNKNRISNKRNSGINLQLEKSRPSIENKKIIDDMNIAMSKQKRGVNYIQKKITFNLESQPKDTNALFIHRPLALTQEANNDKIIVEDNNNFSQDNNKKMNFLIENKRSSQVLPIKKYSDFDEKLTLIENTKRLSHYVVNVKPKISEMVERLNEEFEEKSFQNFNNSENSDDLMDEKEEFNIERKIENLKKKEVPIMNNGEFVKWDMQGLEKQPQQVKTAAIDSEKELYEEVSRKSNTKLEKALIDGITHQVIILIMILLIGYPMLDPSFLMNLIYSSEFQPLRPNFCIDLIFFFMSSALNDSYFIKPLNISINQCFYASDFLDISKKQVDPEVERFLFLEFNESQLFFQIEEKYNISLLANHSDNLMTSDLYVFKKEKREEHDYFHSTYNLDQNNNITLYYDISKIGKIESILNMLKSIYVAILLVVGSYVSSLDVSDLVILPLDKIFTKLNMNLKNLELIDKDESDQNNYNEEIPNDSDIINLSNLFKDEEMNTHRWQSNTTKQKNISKAEKNLKNSLEPYFIDKYLYWFLKLIEMSIGKIGFLIIPISNLDKDLSLNLSCPAIKFETVGLFLRVSNTDKLFYKYMNKAQTILSKLFTIFHSIGVVFSGEIYKKENVNAIFWKRNKKEWMTKSKYYTRDLLNKNNEAVEEEQGAHTQDIFQKHLADLGILTAVKVINIFYTKITKTMAKLKQCEVKFDFFLSSGEIMECLLGDENTANEFYYGNMVNYSNNFTVIIYFIV